MQAVVVKIDQRPSYICEDPLSEALASRVAEIAAADVSVLITGETGTGKERIARRLHALSERRDGPFIAVNCGAIPETLIEAELFGHERGAFTGAAMERAGWFEAANGGVLFLDEIGDMPLALQAKLLRALQEREVYRVGSRQPRRIDVRLITATHVDLNQAMLTGAFRSDLYYRIDVASLHLAPLRERPGDIAPLARHFLAVHGKRLGKLGFDLSGDAVAKLAQHSWPGNIRELENVIQRALIIATGGTVQAQDLSLGARSQDRPKALPPEAQSATDALASAYLRLLQSDGTRCYDLAIDTLISTAFEFCHQNQLQAAECLGISRNVLRAHLARLGYIKGRSRGASPSDETGRRLAASPARGGPPVVSAPSQDEA